MESGIIEVDINTLTKREQQVLAMIGRGYSVPKIADTLFRSQKTIETHRQSLGRKLGAKNRVELARIAIQIGLAPLDIDPALTPDNRDDPRVLLRSDARAAEAVFRIESGCSELVDVAFARALVRRICETLDISGAAIFVFDQEENTYRSAAMWTNLAWVDQVIAIVAGAPCERTLAEGFYCCEGEVAQQWPGFVERAGLPIESYMGVRLDDPTTREVLGCLTVFHDQPTKFNPVTETVLRVCGVRTGAELGRMQLIDSLQRSVETLEQRVAQLEGEHDEDDPHESES